MKYLFMIAVAVAVFLAFRSLYQIIKKHIDDSRKILKLKELECKLSDSLAGDKPCDFLDSACYCLTLKTDHLNDCERKELIKDVKASFGKCVLRPINSDVLYVLHEEKPWSSFQDVERFKSERLLDSFGCALRREDPVASAIDKASIEIIAKNKGIALTDDEIEDQYDEICGIVPMWKVRGFNSRAEWMQFIKDNG